MVERRDDVAEGDPGNARPVGSSTELLAAHGATAELSPRQDRPTGRRHAMRSLGVAAMALLGPPVIQALLALLERPERPERSERPGRPGQLVQRRR